MSEGLVREIAEQIVREQMLTNWLFYAVLLGVWLLGTVTSTFIVSYMRKRAETYATRADLSELLDQLRATTAAAEEVKSAISHSDWSTREWQTLRRIKLEELLATVYEVREWLDRDMSTRFGNGPKVDEKSPISKLEVVSRLYFPEIFEEVCVLEVVYHAYRIWVLTVHQQFLNANQDGLKMQSIFDGAKSGMQEHHRKMLDAMSAIERKAPQLMREITGV